ncbi:MAG: permease, partial [Planctomycetota bacterium]
AIALVLIAFSQFPKLAADPIVGFASLVIVLATLVSRGELPFKIPGALGAVAAGCLIWYLLIGIDRVAGTEIAHQAEAGTVIWFPQEWLTVFSFGWTSSFGDALAYIPYIIPFAIATVIGGIDCTESAASAGDEYNTNTVIGIEAIATLLAAICGGVIQTTPYIGHPAYKAMGGRAAYTLATALFVGGAGVIGYFTLLFNYIPEAAVLPILIFIGIEITAQSFHATSRRHYAAIAIACLPALAKLIVIYVGQYATPDQMANDAGLLILRVLAGGFIITSVIWASAMANIIDRKFRSAALYFCVAGILVLFGVMHSPVDGDKMFWPWNIGMIEQGDGTLVADPTTRSTIIELSVAYFVMAAIVFVLDFASDGKVIESDEEYESLAH